MCIFICFFLLYSNNNKKKLWNGFNCLLPLPRSSSSSSSSIVRIPEGVHGMYLQFKRNLWRQYKFILFTQIQIFSKFNVMFGVCARVCGCVCLSANLLHALIWLTLSGSIECFPPPPKNVFHVCTYTFFYRHEIYALIFSLAHLHSFLFRNKLNFCCEMKSNKPYMHMHIHTGTSKWKITNYVPFKSIIKSWNSCEKHFGLAVMTTWLQSAALLNTWLSEWMIHSKQTFLTELMKFQWICQTHF